MVKFLKKSLGRGLYFFSPGVHNNPCQPNQALCLEVKTAATKNIEPYELRMKFKLRIEGLAAAIIF